MIVNTRTGKLTLTKTERSQLAKASALLLAISKHGNDTAADFAEVAADQIDKTLAALSPEEVAV